MNNKKNIKYNKEFGIIFGIFFLILHFYIFKSEILDVSVFIVVSFILFTISFTKPKLLSFFSYIWFLFGAFIGNFASKILLFFIFILVLTPLSFLLKIIKSDPLNLRFKDKKSYWEKSKKKINFDEQF